MSERRTASAVVLLTILILAVFWRAVTGGIFYFGDIYQLHYPLRAAYAEELKRLALPLWSTDVLAGFPLLAEGQVGALYPPNLLLHLLLPVPMALNVFVVGHFVFAAVGAFAFALHLGLRRTAALCTGMVFSLSAFMVAHLNHINIVATASWLPWLFLLVDRVVQGVEGRRRTKDVAVLSMAVAMGILAGHPQISLLSVLSAGAYGLYVAARARAGVGAVVLLGLSLLLGIALAAPQLLPTAELTAQSVRAGGLDPAYFTSFSLHPAYLVNLVSPFLLGNPYPSVSVELMSYIGWLPLLLALGVPILSRRRVGFSAGLAAPARFFAVTVVVALVLALGRWNPLYLVLARLPLVNLFRVPARYLYLFTFGMAVLAGIGMHALLPQLSRPRPAEDGNLGLVLVAVVTAVVSLGISAAVRLDELLQAWRWLPGALGALALLWMVAAARMRGKSPVWWGLVALLLIGLDLTAFNGVYGKTYNQTMPVGDFVQEPRSLSFFQRQEGIYRVYTQEQILPVLPVMRESMFPNMSLIHGLESANGHFPLMPARYQDYVEQMTPRMLDLLGVRYYAIPQVLPVDEASEFYDLENPFGLNPVDRLMSFAATETAALEVESYLSHSVELDDGAEVAEIRLEDSRGASASFVLRAGWHTAEWAYDRSDVLASVRHAQAPVLRSWPARSGFPPEDHSGAVYLARFQLPASMDVNALQVRATVPSAYLRIERLHLVDASGQRHNLAHLMDRGDHTLAYRSEDVALYENHDALPRVFLVHEARQVDSDQQALDELRDVAFDPARTVVLSAGGELPAVSAPEGPESVELRTYDSRKVIVAVEADAPGYLLLADLWYPGWKVSVDGEGVPLYRADLAFRAVFVPAGAHRVEFHYMPGSFSLGLKVSGVAVLGLVALGFFGWMTKTGNRVSTLTTGQR